MILVVGQNVAWQKVCTLPRLVVGGVSRIEEVRAFPSSKGPNVARTLAAFGTKALVLGYAGGDTGRLFVESFTREGLAGDFTRIRAETRTCTTFVDREGTCSEVIEPPPEIDGEEREAFRRSFGAHIGGARVLVISGTVVRGESEDCYRSFAREARSRGAVVLVDSSGREARHALAEKPEVWKVNRHELAEIVGHPVDDMPERIRAYRTLATRFGVRWVMASHGAEGMECFNGSVLRHAVPPRVRVVNSIGSGDAATAGVAWVLDARGDGCPAGDLLDSDDCAREALVTATAMGTANCLNAVNGKVLREDFTRIRDQVRVREIPLA